MLEHLIKHQTRNGRSAWFCYEQQDPVDFESCSLNIHMEYV